MGETNHGRKILYHMNSEAKITLNHGQMQAEICLAFFIKYLSVFVSISVIDCITDITFTNHSFQHKPT